MATRSNTRVTIADSWLPAWSAEFVSENLRSERELLDCSGLRGTRDHRSEHFVRGACFIRGQLVLEPSRAELFRWLPLILGGSWTADVPAALRCSMAESIPAFQVIVERPPRRYRYEACKVVAAELLARRGAPVRLALELEGLRETFEGASLAPPAFSPEPPLCFDGAELEIEGAPVECAAVQFDARNVPLPDRFVFSTTRVDLPIVDRALSVHCELATEPENDELFPPGETSGALRLGLLSAGGLRFEFARVLYSSRYEALGPGQGGGGIWLAGRPVASSPGGELVAIFQL